MKKAVKTVPVYASNGQNQIGELKCGDEAWVLGEDENGIIIAFVQGRIKKEDAGALVDADEQTVCDTDRLMAYVASKLGCLYVWGAQGQKMTSALMKKMENSVTNYRRALKQYQKHTKNKETVVAYDCSGLIVSFLLDGGYIGRDTTANGLYVHHCTAISKSDLMGGDLVFKKYRTKNTMYHVGVYMGDGIVVHAKGRDDGVVRERLSATGWNRFGRLKMFAAAGETGYTRMIKNTGEPHMFGGDVRAVQTALEAKGFDVGGIDGVYGNNTEQAVRAFQEANALEVDGVVGPMTWGCLMGGE